MVLVEVDLVVSPFSVQVEVSLEAVVTREPDTEPAGPSAVNEMRCTMRNREPSRLVYLLAEWSILLML